MNTILINFFIIHTVFPEEVKWKRAEQVTIGEVTIDGRAGCRVTEWKPRHSKRNRGRHR